MRILLKFLLVILLIIPKLLKAQKQNPWNSLHVSARYSDKWQEIPSTKKQLDKVVLHHILEKVNTNGKTTIVIPTPEGLDSYFEIMASNAMAPALQAKYPTIKTYKGINEKGEKIRLSMSINEFRATVFSDKGAYGINPESTNSDVYVSYRWADYNRVHDVVSELSCGVESKIETEIVNQLASKTIAADFTPRRTGDVHTKLRMVIIPDLNYVNHFGGTVEGALSGIVTSINTVNGIFERDTSISFELVENNDEIIYTQRSEYESDEHYEIINNYSLNSMTTLLNELIGVENYDIGHHILEENGGGIAAVSSVCKDNDKAKGVSGNATNRPEGYIFDVTVLSHELGHQLGAEHTFSANCTGNSSGNDAYEIGSGVTVMGYGFGCSAEDTFVYPVFDYFNARSIEKIIRTVENNCGEFIATGNTPPTVSIPESGFTIPINTPFILEAVGNDEDGDAITYCWEQYDKATKVESVKYGTKGENGEVFYTVEEFEAYAEQYLTNLENGWIEEGYTTDDYGAALSAITNGLTKRAGEFWAGDGPLFRSFYPTGNNKRYFPELPTVIDGTADKLSFEVMPHKTRDLNFVVTVRDNSILGAGIASDIVSFSSTETAGPFKVTTAFTDANYIALRDIELAWDVANTNTSPVNCQTVDILYSTNGGATFDLTLLAGIPNNSNATINLPNIETTAGRIMVKAADNIFFNVNDTNFIVASVLTIDENEFSDLEIYPNPVNNILHVDTKEEVLLKLIDLNGKTLLTKNIKENTNLDITNLSSGMYILNLKSNYNTTYKKILKK